MLHKTVYITSIQICCPKDDVERYKIAGQMRNLFYTASFPWCEGNLGRAIPILTYDEFYAEFARLRKTFRAGLKREDFGPYEAALTTIPLPPLTPALNKETSEFISTELKERFDRRLHMLQEALEKEKRFYSSLLDELEKVIEIGLFLKKDINPKLVSRMKKAQAHILQFTSVDIRRSTSVKEDVITYCGALL